MHILHISSDLSRIWNHWNCIRVFGLLPVHHAKSLGWPPQFLDKSYSMTRLRLDFVNSTNKCEIDVLGDVLDRNITRNIKNLAIFLEQRQSHFPEIIRVIAVSHIYIQHLEIHQFSLLRYVHKYQTTK